MSVKTKLLTIGLTTLTLAGCAGPGGYYGGYPYRNTVTGAALGAAGGALIGRATDDGYGNGTVVGGALGALAGGAAGYYLDKRDQQPPQYRGNGYGYERPRRHRNRDYDDYDYSYR